MRDNEPMDNEPMGPAEADDGTTPGAGGGRMPFTFAFVATRSLLPLLYPSLSPPPRTNDALPTSGFPRQPQPLNHCTVFALPRPSSSPLSPTPRRCSAPSTVADGMDLRAKTKKPLDVVVACYEQCLSLRSFTPELYIDLIRSAINFFNSTRG